MGAVQGPPLRNMFTGRRFEKEAGLYYYRLRYYDLAIGRFLQPDPIGYAVLFENVCHEDVVADNFEIIGI